ncbi:hypothetical protein CHUAL_006554 [Chamberlinius hualienensis]
MLTKDRCEMPSNHCRQVRLADDSKCIDLLLRCREAELCLCVDQRCHSHQSLGKSGEKNSLHFKQSESGGLVWIRVSPYCARKIIIIKKAFTIPACGGNKISFVMGQHFNFEPFWTLGAKVPPDTLKGFVIKFNMMKQNNMWTSECDLGRWHRVIRGSYFARKQCVYQPFKYCSRSS